MFPPFDRLAAIADAVMRTLLRRRTAWFAALVLSLAGATAEATDFLVGSASEFQAAILAVNASAGGAHRILVQNDFSITTFSPFNFTGTVDIVGGGRTISTTTGWSNEFVLQNGAIRLDNVTLADFNSLNNPFFAMYGGSTLSGEGTIRGYLETNGRISPGSTPGDIGTLQIIGQFHLQDATAMYEVDIDASGQSDRIEASQILLSDPIHDAGNVLVRARPGKYVDGTRYTILKTTHRLDGELDVIAPQGLPRFWTIRAEYDALNAYLVIDGSGVTPFAKTTNQVEAAAAVMDSIFTHDAALNQVFDALEQMTDDDKRATFDQLGGEVFGSVSSVGFQNTSNWLGAVANRIRPLRSDYASLLLAQTEGNVRNPVGRGSLGADSLQLVAFNPAFGFSSPTPDLDRQIAEGREHRKYNGWTGGYGASGDASGDGNAQGVDYRFAGTSFGVDRYLGDGTTVGFAGGYSGTYLGTENLRQEADVNSYQAALYGGRVGERFYAFNVLSYGFNDYKTVRRLPASLAARGEYGGDEIADYLEAGMFVPDNVRSLQPSLNLQYIGLRRQAFTETGAGGAGLAVGSQFDHSLRPGAGLRFVSPTTLRSVTFTPEFHARYAFEVLDVERSATANFSAVPGATFTTAGNRLGRHFGQFGVGVTAAFSRGFRCYGGYDLLTADSSTAHAGSGGLQFLW